MLGDRVVEVVGVVRQAEPQVVHRHAAERVAQPNHDMAVEEAPRRVPVTEEDHRSRALVGVVPVDVASEEVMAVDVGTRGHKPARGSVQT